MGDDTVNRLISRSHAPDNEANNYLFACDDSTTLSLIHTHAPISAKSQVPMAKQKSYRAEPVPAKFRMIAAILVPGAAFLAGILIHQAWTEAYIFYGALKRDAPVIKEPYTAFVMLIILPMLILLIPAMSIAAWTGKKFDPSQGSFLYTLQIFALKATIYGMASILPTTIALTIIFSSISDYSRCPELTHGKRGTSLWVNDECFCFKPDYHINRNWPCKTINGKEVCIEIQGW